MATTAIWKVTTNLARVVSYASHPAKTEQCLYVTGLNCDPATAADEMKLTKKVWGKEGGILAFHAYQSFAQGECTAAEAHKIGQQLARKLWGDRFQVVVGTHVDRGHIHTHFVLNSVSFVDGKRYYDQKKTYYGGLRKESDDLCREHGKSVIEHPQGRGRNYREHMEDKAGNPSMCSFIKADVEEAIRSAPTFAAFVEQLRRWGYEVKHGPNVAHMKVRPPGSARFFRLDRKAIGYPENAIRTAIAGSLDRQERQPEPASRPPRRYRTTGPLHKPRRKLKGFTALYFRYMYLLGKVRRGAPRRAVYPLRADALQFRRYQKQFLFLHHNSIHTMTDLNRWQERAAAQRDALLTERNPLYQQRRKATEQNEIVDLSRQIQIINSQLRELRQGIAACDKIREAAPSIRENIRQQGAPAPRQTIHRNRPRPEL